MLCSVHGTYEHSSGDAILWLAASLPFHPFSIYCIPAPVCSFLVPQLPPLDPYPMSVLHEAVPNTMTFLSQAGTPDLPLPVWLIAFDGWLALADIELKGMLVDADRNHFLLDLLGTEAI